MRVYYFSGGSYICSSFYFIEWLRRKGTRGKERKEEEEEDGEVETESVQSCSNNQQHCDGEIIAILVNPYTHHNLNTYLKRNLHLFKIKETWRASNYHVIKSWYASQPSSTRCELTLGRGGERDLWLGLSKDSPWGRPLVWKEGRLSTSILMGHRKPTSFLISPLFYTSRFYQQIVHYFVSWNPALPPGEAGVGTGTPASIKQLSFFWVFTSILNVPYTPPPIPHNTDSEGVHLDQNLCQDHASNFSKFTLFCFLSFFCVSLSLSLFFRFQRNECWSSYILSLHFQYFKTKWFNLFQAKLVFFFFLMSIIIIIIFIEFEGVGRENIIIKICLNLNPPRKQMKEDLVQMGIIRLAGNLKKIGILCHSPRVMRFKKKPYKEINSPVRFPANRSWFYMAVQSKLSQCRIQEELLEHLLVTKMGEEWLPFYTCYEALWRHGKKARNPLVNFIGLPYHSFDMFPFLYVAFFLYFVILPMFNAHVLKSLNMLEQGVSNITNPQLKTKFIGEEKTFFLKRVDISKPINYIMIDLVIFDTPCLLVESLLFTKILTASNVFGHRSKSHLSVGVGFVPIGSSLTFKVQNKVDHSKTGAHLNRMSNSNPTIMDVIELEIEANKEKACELSKKLHSLT
ncbi:hypothetical protein VP01_210g3 [Puccinia sorghi]|uniref:Uncharacterized protein n=1 Tax=Puccinia sorghi TaxID=27349 RepID=A0A0L6VA83_9BASI|nr:hypothetical protein VP01_210g3 [Puccinia sorghi]